MLFYHVRGKKLNVNTFQIAAEGIKCLELETQLTLRLWLRVKTDLLRDARPTAM